MLIFTITIIIIIIILLYYHKDIYEKSPDIIKSKRQKIREYVSIFNYYNLVYEMILIVVLYCCNCQAFRLQYSSIQFDSTLKKKYASNKKNKGFYIIVK